MLRMLTFLDRTGAGARDVWASATYGVSRRRHRLLWPGVREGLRVWIVSIAWATFVLGVAAPASAQDSDGALAGVVTSTTDAGPTPVVGAMVTACPLQSGARLCRFRRRTDSTGEYRIVLPPGSYVARVFPPGKNPRRTPAAASASVAITSGGTTVQDFHLVLSHNGHAAELTGVVRAEAAGGHPVAGAVVEACPATAGTDKPCGAGVTDQSGNHHRTAGG